MAFSHQKNTIKCCHDVWRRWGDGTQSADNSGFCRKEKTMFFKTANKNQTKGVHKGKKLTIQNGRLELKKKPDKTGTKGNHKKIWRNQQMPWNKQQWSDKVKGRQGLFIQKGSGQQVKTIKGRTDNETQATKIKGQRKKAEKRKTGNKAWKNARTRDFQNETGNTHATELEKWYTKDKILSSCPGLH